MEKKKAATRRSTKRKTATRKKGKQRAQVGSAQHAFEDSTTENREEEDILSGLTFCLSDIEEAEDKIWELLHELHNRGKLDELRDELIAIGVKVNKEGYWRYATDLEKTNKDWELHFRHHPESLQALEKMDRKPRKKKR